MTTRPSVSLVVSVLNEADILEENIAEICRYMDSIGDRYDWELLIVNDGSTDDTGSVAETLAAQRDNIFVLHHPKNFGLGQALRYAINVCRGDYLVTLDVDLTYSPNHILPLLERIQKTGAKVVTASPYASGGQTTAVPWRRRAMSIWANRFLSLTAGARLKTLTGMVRAYDTRFLRKLSLRSMGMEINPEVIYKTLLLHGRIEEIPAHLDWSRQREPKGRRRSHIKVFRQTMSVLLSGFLFRPVTFLILPGLGFLAISVYSSTWVLIHILNASRELSDLPWIMGRISESTEAAFQFSPHSFIIAGLSLIIAIQFISLAILALQSRSYFEEVFNLGSILLSEAHKPGNSAGVWRHREPDPSANVVSRLSDRDSNMEADP